MDLSSSGGAVERNDAEASDTDSDLEELQGDIAKFDESVREFLASQRDEAGQPRELRNAPRGRGARGPRKAAKPRGDITARLAKVNQAFLGGDYSLALDLVFEVIRINAETHQAWTTLSSIFREQGDLSKALSAMVYAAHLRPKDVGGWLRCASFALDTMEDDETENLHTARLCYSAALRADHTNIDARLGKAMVCHKQGHLSAAIVEYKIVLKQRPFDLEIVRKLAEACVDNKHADTAVPTAISAYERFFEHERIVVASGLSHAPWHDVGIYVELFASTGRYLDAIGQLKSLSRWFLGRGSENYWDNWQTDDREWDADDKRRVVVSEFGLETSDSSLYGRALPHDLRARLAIYRFRIGDELEAMRHLWWFDPLVETTRDFAADFPFLAFDVAEELAHRGETSLAIKYYEILRDLPGDVDATVLLQLGRCHSAKGEHATAEEYFLAAIDADEESIDARVELANMYEKAREDEEALILAAEAMALREARDQDHDQGQHFRGLSVPYSSARSEGRVPRRRGIGPRDPDHPSGKRVLLRRYRPKRLAGPDKRRQDEQSRAVKLSQQYEIVRNLRQQIKDGRDDLVSAWMASSKELVDDFRSLKKFYTWEKYLNFLGSKSSLEDPDPSQPKTELSRMYERLARTIAPYGGPDGLEQRSTETDNHQGISFDNWLDLFLDYAIGLAMVQRRDEAYQVCEAARDSTAFQTPEHGFIIHVAWTVCAIYMSDEEKCVATARQLMRDGAMSDSYRMFALLSSLCQSPVSWYTSGPAQKYILRQIKATDDAHEASTVHGESTNTTGTAAELSLDACLLMLYGHILFTSTSYTYALGYFLRSRALDPNNPMVNLSLGLAYVHYGLKRQSTNRQYLLLQGQSFLSQYADLGYDGQGDLNPCPKAEA
ncbi:transcription factor TFIIIC subunit tfc4, partial [Neonectria punicea]